MIVVGQQNLVGVDQLGLAVQQGVLETKLKRRCERVYLDVFSPCYENQDEAGGDEDEEECSNNFPAAQLVTTYLLYGSIIYITCMAVSHISHEYHMSHITCMGVTTYILYRSIISLHLVKMPIFSHFRQSPRAESFNRKRKADWFAGLSIDTCHVC